MIHRTVRALATLTLLLAAAALAAQQSGQAPTFRSNVELVRVDVVVTDLDGKPVHGLKAEDFTIRDRGKPQQIASFEEVSPATISTPPRVFPTTLRADVASNQAIRTDRLVVIVVDDLHIFHDRTDKAREVAKHFIESLGANTPTAVVFTSGKGDVDVTDDTASLLAAIDHFKGQQSTRRPSSGANNPSGADSNLQDFFNNLTAYKIVEQAAKAIGAANSGRKAFVLISEGAAADLSGVFDAMQGAPDMPNAAQQTAQLSGAAGDPNNTTVASMPPVTYHENAIVEMMEMLRRANVATYAIDPRGLIEPKDVNRECFPPPMSAAPTRSVGAAGGCDPCTGTCRGQVSAMENWVRLAQNGLVDVAEASGGFAVTNTNDLDGGADAIVGDLDNYYLLGFRPSNAGGQGYRSLDVRVTGHPDYVVRYRRGYDPAGPPAPKVVANADPLFTLAASVLPSADFPMRLFAAPLPRPTKVAHVALAMELTTPVAPLLEPDGKLHDTVNYELVVLDENRAQVASRTGRDATFVLAPARGVAPAPSETATYQISTSIDLPPGRYEVRIAATSVKLARSASVFLPVDVPDFTDAPIGLSGLVLGYANGPHVPDVRSPDIGRATPPRRGRRGGAPVRLTTPTGPDLPFEPSLDRVFSRTDGVRVYFEIAQKDASAHISATIALLDAADHAVKELTSAVPPQAHGRVSLTVPLADYPPGPYRVRVTITDGKHTASRDLGLVIKP